jgi:type IV secretory pathway VirB2 component (pilin)
MTLTVLLAGGNLSWLLLLHTIFGVAPIFLAAAAHIMP